jgi:hypothetical protein
MISININVSGYLSDNQSQLYPGAPFAETLWQELVAPWEAITDTWNI